MFRIIILLFSCFLLITAHAAIVAGNSKGNVTMIEVYDYQCPHCHTVFPTVQKLIDSNHDLKLRLMPVAILNQVSIYEAAASIAATNYSGKFDEFTNLVMSEPPLTKEGVDHTLREIGLTSPQFVASMHSKEVEQQMMEGLQFLKLEHSGTPLFIIYPTANPHLSKVLEGEQNFQTLEKVIDNARSGS